METSESITSIAPALVKALAEIEAAQLDCTGQIGNTKYKYASLASIIETGRKHLSAYEIAVLQPHKYVGDSICVETVLLHSSGEWVKGETFLPLGEAGRGSVAQAAGSAYTYARRYGLASILGIAVEDDDGASAGGWKGSKAQTQSQSQSKPQSQGQSPAARALGYAKQNPNALRALQVEWEKEMGERLPMFKELSADALEYCYDFMVRYSGSVTDVLRGTTEEGQ